VGRGRVHPLASVRPLPRQIRALAAPDSPACVLQRRLLLAILAGGLTELAVSREKRPLHLGLHFESKYRSLWSFTLRSHTTRTPYYMSDTTLEPRNELERQLVLAHQGEVSMDELLATLLNSQLFMPVRDNLGIGGFQDSQRAVPLSLEAEGGTQVLILFSSPERAKAFLQDFPGFEGGILEDFKWMLKRMGSGYGISVNPDWDFGVDLEPDTVLQLAQEAENS
ncbi:MAG: SseB family protein, partial [Gammaproteobacteria bacterium]